MGIGVFFNNRKKKIMGENIVTKVDTELGQIYSEK